MLDKQDLETIDSLSLEWLENMLNQYKKANLPCQVKEMTKLVNLKKDRIKTGASCDKEILCKPKVY